MGGDAVGTLHEFLYFRLHPYAPGGTIARRQMFLLSRTEYPSYAVSLSQDRDTQRVYRLPVFAKYQLIRPGVAHCVASRVNWTGKLHLVIESVRLDPKHAGCSTVAAPVDGAGGLPLS